MGKLRVSVDFSRAQWEIFNKESEIGMVAIDCFNCYYNGNMYEMIEQTKDLRWAMFKAMWICTENVDSYEGEVFWEEELLDSLVKSGNFELISKDEKSAKVKFLWNRRE